MLGLLLLLLAAGAAAQSCTRQADCAVGQYCDDYDRCRACSAVSPSSTCYARTLAPGVDANCCDAAFLAQCLSNPYGCRSSQADCAVGSCCDTLYSDNKCRPCSAVSPPS